MALDLAIGLCVLTVLSVVAFRRGRSLAARCGQSVRPLCLAVSLLVALLFSWSLSGRLGWAMVLPFASVILWSNLMPILLCFAAGLAIRTPGFGRGHRVATILALFSLAIGYAFTPVVRPLFAPAQTAASAHWRDGACLQTHASTCAPAAAATLLRSAGIASDERSLADACLTSRSGTEPLGLFRGLAIASDRRWCRPRVASRDPDQWTARDQLPNVALVRFSETPDRGSLRRFLGPRGEGHVIVVRGCDTRGNWLIEDPAFGNTTWTDQQFRSRFTGDAIFLASRSD